MSDSSITFLKQVLDGCMERQRVLANNVANANTPGFVRSDVHFRSELAAALKNQDVKELESMRFEAVPDKVSPDRIDGNNVNVSKELGEMADNRILYEMAIRATSSKYERLRSVIKGQ